MRPLTPVPALLLLLALSLAACRQSSAPNSKQISPGAAQPRHVAAAKAACTTTSATTSSWAEIDLTEHPGGCTLRTGGVTVTLRAQGEADDSQRAVAHVQVPGFPPLDVPLVEASAGGPLSVGIGKLNRSDAASSVIFQPYWGGAHCCYVIRVIVPGKAKLQIVDFPLFDPIFDEEDLAAFPRDIDNDGYGDIILDDIRFDDEFGSHAGTWEPPLVLNIVDGRLLDVSGRASFAPIFQKFASKARASCADTKNEEPAGACAAYAAAEARLGHSQKGIEEAVKFANADGFNANLRSFLNKTGYAESESNGDRPLHCPAIKSPDEPERDFEDRVRLC